MAKSDMLFWLVAFLTLVVAAVVAYTTYKAIEAAIALMTFLSLLATWGGTSG